MTIGDLFANLILILVVSLPALLFALVHEKKWLLKNPGMRPYTWGFFTGYVLTFGGVLILASSLTYPLWADPEEYTAAEIALQVTYATVVCLIPGIFILCRKRWAWIWEIVASLVLAPVRIPFDIIYLRSRWQEMKRGAQQAIPATSMQSALQPRRSVVLPLLASVLLGILVFVGGCYFVLRQVQGNAPIHDAVSAGDLTRVQSLVQQDRSVLNVPNRAGSTPLHLAVLAGHAQLVDYLVRAGAPVDQLTSSGWTPLVRASEVGSVEVVRTLLDLRADVNFRTQNYGNSALHRAANSGHIDVARLLIARGAQVNIRNKSNNTPLHRAVDGDHPDMVELLIASGADVNIRNDYGRTPLKIATEADYRKCARILREKGGRE